MKTPYDKLDKVITNCTGHMTKMTAMPIFGKNNFKIFFSRTRRQMTLGMHLPFTPPPQKKKKKKNIRNFKHPKKIFEILATEKISPILYLDLKNRS